MEKSEPSTTKQMYGFGLLAAGVGVYFILVSLGALPVPGGREALHAPLWIAFAAGLSFLFGGLALVLRAAAGGTLHDGKLPPSAPRWMRVVEYLFMLAIFASFGAIGTWIAFGSGEREITVSGPFFSGPAKEWFGRAVFGIGAVIIWLCTIALAISAARKLFGRGRP